MTAKTRHKGAEYLGRVRVNYVIYFYWPLNLQYLPRNDIGSAVFE